MLRAHSWEWMLDHSDSKSVTELRQGGFDKVMVMPYFYNSIRHEQEDGSIRHVRTPAKKEGRIIAINRGQNIRVIYGFGYMSSLPPTKKDGKCEWCGHAGDVIDTYFDKFWRKSIVRYLCSKRKCGHEWTQSK